MWPMPQKQQTTEKASVTKRINKTRPNIVEAIGMNNLKAHLLGRLLGVYGSGVIAELETALFFRGFYSVALRDLYYPFLCAQ